MTTDARGTPVSISNQSALGGYEAALRQYQSYVGDPVATIEGVLAEHPELVLGHVFRAGVLMTFGEARFATEARRSIEAAESHVGSANDRERALARAVRLLVDGKWQAAGAAFDSVLVDHPRDAFAIQTAHLFDFFCGDTLNLRNRIMRVLPAWDASVPGYSFVLGMHAFGLEENYQYADAMAAAERALSIEPKDAWAVHAGVHVSEMNGNIDDGIEWLESRRDDWAPENSFAFHNWWHLALFHLDHGDHRRVLELFDTAIYPSPSDISLTLVDASALLWRLHLLGVDVGDRFERVADMWQAKLVTERGFYAFNDVHAMFAFAASGREAAIAQLLADMETAPGANGTVTREIGLPIAGAVLAFTQGRYDEVIEQIAQVRDTAHRFGGSHAQRDVLTLTLVEACLRGNRPSVARHYLAERTVSRPRSRLGQRLAARVS